MDSDIERISPNDSVWFCLFDWSNIDKAAVRLEVDVNFTESDGNTFSYLDARLENDLYVTIGIRQLETGDQQASMSVLHDPNNPDARKSFFQLLQKERLPSRGFLANRGGENDLYYIGNFPFDFGEYYRFIIFTDGNQVEGYIYRWSNKELVKIGTFLTGEGSRIRARRGKEHTNGITLEHFGMFNACEKKSRILVRNPLRVDVTGVRASALKGRVDYQKCSNANVDRDDEDNIILSHGGDTIRDGAAHLEFLPWSEKPIDLEINLDDFINK